MAVLQGRKKGSISFLKKRNKKLLKVFWFFFSKENYFFLPYASR
jgi:hypothetical protein